MEQQQASQHFHLPAKLDKLIATVARYYKRNDNPLMERIIINSKYDVEEGVEYDNWDGGTYGHAITFFLPTDLYDEILDFLENYEEDICKFLNRISKVRNEFINAVCFEPQDDGVVESLINQSSIEPAIMDHDSSDEFGIEQNSIWEEDYFRVFISHKSAYKKQTANIKDALNYYGITAFVAHEDIEPTKEWQSEIERALFSMESIVALLTNGFKNSNWTDQELGVALGRQVPIIPIKIDINPYGLIGKYQALVGTGKDSTSIAHEIYNLLWSQPSVRPALIRSLVKRFEDSSSFAHSTLLLSYLEKIDTIPPELIDRLEQANEDNYQVKNCWDVQNRFPDLITKLRLSS